MERLIALDTKLFLFLNGIHSPCWDKIMYLVSGKIEWLPLYLILTGWIIYRYRMKSILIIISVIILITLTDQISTKVFKFGFERLRPCHNPDISHLVRLVKNHCGGQYGFVSSHAANSFGLAVFLTLLLKKKWFSWSIIAWAALVSYSRVYLGVHYPGDILGGAVLGTILSLGVYWVYRLIEKKYVKI